MLERAVRGESTLGVGTAYRNLLVKIGVLVLASRGVDAPRTNAGSLEEGALSKALKDEQDAGALPKSFVDAWRAGSKHASKFQHTEPPPPPVSSLDLAPLIEIARYYEINRQRLDNSATAEALEDLHARIKSGTLVVIPDDDTWRDDPTVLIYRQDDARTTLSLAQWLESGVARVFGDALGELAITTPVLGPGAQQVGATDEQVDWDVALEIEAEADESLLSYLFAVRDGRLDGRSVRERRVDAVPESLTLMRFAMLRLCHHMTRRFIEAWNGALSPIDDWEDHSVHIEVDTELDDLFLQVIAGLKTVRATKEQVDSGLLGVDSIIKRLERIRSDLGEVDNTAAVTGSLVEFLTDLLWHVITFDSAVYPRMDELALQVSLVLKGNGPVRRVEPGLAIDRSTVSDLERAVRVSVERGFCVEDQPSIRSEFLQALAKVLHADYARPSVASRSLKPFHPVALSSTFDLELERALALAGSRGAAFHVGLPVFVWADVQSDAPIPRIDGRLRWVVGEFDCGSINDLSGLIEPKNGWKWLEDLDPSAEGDRGLVGPLVLKISGSPLHRLPDTVAGDPGLRKTVDETMSVTDRKAAGQEPDSRLNHSVLLGEFDVMQFMRIDQWAYDKRGAKTTIRQGLPTWISQALRDRRRQWLFLGQRMHDWNARLQLYTQLSRTTVLDGRSVAISLRFDEDHSRLLDWMSVKKVRGDYQDLVPYLEELATEIANRSSVS